MSRLDQTLIAGVGSPHGDDRLGWLAVEWLCRRAPWLRAEKLRTPLDLLDRLPGPERLVLIDAALAPQQAVGTVRCCTWPAVDAQSISPASTHGLGLVESLRIADSLGILPACTLLVAGVVSRDGSHPHELSLAAKELIAALGERVLAECDAWPAASGER